MERVTLGGTSGRDVTNAGIRLALEAVERALGAAVVADVLRCAGEDRSMAILRDDTEFSTYAQFRRVLEAAAAVLGGADQIEAIAELPVFAGTRPSTLELIEALGSPNQLFQQTTGSGTNGMVLFIESTGHEVDANEWLFETRTAPGYEPFPELCAFIRGLDGIGPRLFGHDTCTVVEETCQCRGDDWCRVRVKWGDVDELTRKVAMLEHSLVALRGRLEGLQETVAGLVQADDLETALERVVIAAAHAVGAPGFVLAVEPLFGLRRDVFSHGLDDETATAVAERLLAGDDGDAFGAMVVEITSKRQHYGRLAACGSSAMAQNERPMLEAYAELAATALDTATALDSAKREAARANALLALAEALAEATSVTEVAECLVAAVPSVIGADRSLMVVADPDQSVTRVLATNGFEPDTAERLRTTEFETRDLTPSGFIYTDPRESVPGGSKAVAMVLVPIMIEGIAEAWLSAEVLHNPERLTPTDELEARLHGLAAQAATAFRNARLVDEMRRLALHDGLTGLPNRSLARGRAETLLALRTARLSALFVDLDHFKEINDTLGHAAGDELLRAVADRLSSTIRETDTLARLGGDEFVLLIDGGDPEFMATRILQVLADPFHLDGHDSALTISASIGIATAVGDVNADELLRDADVAMYEAKAAGKNRYVSYVPELRRSLLDRRALELDLRRAIEEQQFTLLYQPIVDLRSRRVVSVEALLRWQHPERGIVGPDHFIPALEDSGLITTVGRWVLETAAQQTAAWHAAGFPLNVSVNISPRQLDTGTLADDVRSILAMTGLPPESLIVEITETTLMRDTVAATRCLDELKQLGVRLALDDFGTGYSSLAYLRQLPIDILKIDRSFVAASTDSPEAGSFIEMLVQLGHSLGLTILAEGVELPDQLAGLDAEGCDEAQGFYFSRPVPPDDVPALLAG